MELVDDRVGLTVVHRRYVSERDVYYRDQLVNGAFALAGFGDAVTELAIRTDGDEGLLVSYSTVEFHAPIRAGDIVEFEARLVRVRTRVRTVRFTCTIVCRAHPAAGPTAATVLDPALLAVTAEGNFVVASAQHNAA